MRIHPVPAIFAFTCSHCGEVHEGSPSFSYEAPLQYSRLSETQRNDMATLSSDLCTIKDDQGIDYFIRTVLQVPIYGAEEPFSWGVWASLSEKSYTRYLKTYDDPVAGEVFFGYLCNRLPYYPDTVGLPSDVVVQISGIRPKLQLHHGSAHDNQLIVDQYHGITVARAQEIAEHASHGA